MPLPLTTAAHNNRAQTLTSSAGSGGQARGSAAWSRRARGDRRRPWRPRGPNCGSACSRRPAARQRPRPSCRSRRRPTCCGKGPWRYAIRAAARRHHSTHFLLTPARRSRGTRPWHQFIVRLAASLARKPQVLPPAEQPAAAATVKATDGGPPAFDPFLPYDPVMYVDDLPPKHVALLNKFPVVPNHLVVATKGAGGRASGRPPPSRSSDGPSGLGGSGAVPRASVRAADGAPECGGPGRGVALPALLPEPGLFQRRRALGGQVRPAAACVPKSIAWRRSPTPIWRLGRPTPRPPANRTSTCRWCRSRWRPSARSCPSST